MTEILFTERHRDVMLFIQREFAANGIAPRIVDAMKATGLSKTHVHKLIEDLCILGYLAKIKDRARGLSIVRPLPDRFEEAAKAACEAAGADPSTIPAIRDAIAQTLTRAA